MVDASLCACEMWWNFCNVKRVVLLQKNAVDGDDDGIFSGGEVFVVIVDEVRMRL